MHPQRFAILIAALAGIVAASLPWASAKIKTPEPHLYGMSETSGQISMALFAAIALSTLFGGRRKPMPIYLRIVTALFAIAVVGWDALQWNSLRGNLAGKDPGEQMKAMLARLVVEPGTGLYLALAAGITILLLLAVMPFVLPSRRKSVAGGEPATAATDAAPTSPVRVAAVLGLEAACIAGLCFGAKFGLADNSGDEFLRQMEQGKAAAMGAERDNKSATQPRQKFDPGPRELKKEAPVEDVPIGPKLTFKPRPIPTDPQLAALHAVRENLGDLKAIRAYAKTLESSNKQRADFMRLSADYKEIGSKQSEEDKDRRNELERIIESEIEPMKSLKAARISFDQKYGLVERARFENATDETIGILKTIPEIRILELKNPQLSEAGFRIVAQLPHLEELDLGDFSLTREAAPHFDDLPPGARIIAYGSNEVKQDVHAINVRRVDAALGLSPEEQRKAALRYFGKYAYDYSKKKYDKLDIEAISDVEIKLLAHVPEVEILRLQDGLGSNRTIDLAPLSTLINLRELELRYFTPASLQALSNATKLVKLELAIHNTLDAELEGLGKVASLQELAIDGNLITEDALPYIGALKSLRTLKIKVNSPRNWEAFSALAGLAELEHLDIDGACDEAILAHLEPLTKLSSLDLWIRGGDGQNYEVLNRLKNLRRLSVFGMRDHALKKLGHHTGSMTIVASAATREAAIDLANRSVGLMIVTGEGVVRSPRKSYLFKRRKIAEKVSCVVPAEWEEKDSDEIIEDGWSGVKRSARDVPSIEFDETSGKPTALETITREIGSLKITMENVQPIRGSADTASCICEGENSKSLFSYAKVENGYIGIKCSCNKNRFEELEPIFRAVIKSVRISDDPAQHAPQTYEVPVEKLAIPKETAAKS